MSRWLLLLLQKNEQLLRRLCLLMQYFMYTQPKNLLLYKRERERKYREKQNKETLLYKFGHTAAKRRLFIVNQSPRQLIHYIVSLICYPFLPISSIEKRDECIWAQPFLPYYFIIFFSFSKCVWRNRVSSKTSRYTKTAQATKQHSLINRFLLVVVYM